MRLAEASAEAIRRIANGIAEKELPAYYLLGEKYVTALKELAVGPGSRTVVLPADLMKSLEALLGGRRSG